MESKRKSKMDGVQGSGVNQCLNDEEQTAFKNLFNYGNDANLSNIRKFDIFQYRKNSADMNSLQTIVDSHTPELTNISISIRKYPTQNIYYIYQNEILLDVCLSSDIIKYILQQDGKRKSKRRQSSKRKSKRR